MPKPELESPDLIAVHSDPGPNRSPLRKLNTQISRRIKATDAPVIAFTRRIMSLRLDTMNLGQGVVFWPPPPEALQAVGAMLHDPSVSCYGPNEGMPELRAALRVKLEKVNGLKGYDVMITHGGNQAFMNLVLSLVDEGDQVVLFKPAYFDHIMSIQMTGGSRTLVWGDSDPVTLKPSVAWLRNYLLGPGRDAHGKVKMVAIINPNNPTGVLLTRQELQEMADVCEEAGTWLVCDNTYEAFSSFENIVAKAQAEAKGGPAQGSGKDADAARDAPAASDSTNSTAASAAETHEQANGNSSNNGNNGGSNNNSNNSGNGSRNNGDSSSNGVGPGLQDIEEAMAQLELKGHACVSGPHVVHVFSFSKAYGLMGWRVGYIAYPDPLGDGGVLGGQLLKTQDTMCICACQASQHAALAALKYGSSYVADRIAELDVSRRVVLDALSVVGPENVAGGYSIFFWVTLPKGCEDDVATVEWLVRHFGICVVPGSSCAGPGCVRISFGSLRGETLRKACARLKAGLLHLKQHGMENPPDPIEVLQLLQDTA